MIRGLLLLAIVLLGTVAALAYIDHLQYDDWRARRTDFMNRCVNAQPWPSTTACLADWRDLTAEAARHSWTVPQ